ncbi:hypothetical protein [Shinella pollutisoli]|uniref:Bacteriophage lambda head decoration protein D n=1 Tax=Shinella pollutisoli TaxID=2250594 RepID=A0ABV7DIZ9_9HYPH|nr:hypothetical protein [Shinella pollutisoli]
MTLIQSKYAKGIAPIAYPSVAGGVVAMRFAHTIAAAMQVGDILELGVIPAGTRVVDAILDCDDIDTDGAAAVSFDVGIMSGDVGADDGARTCGNQFFSGSTIGRAGGVERASIKTAFRTAAAAADRAIGVKCTAAAAAFAAGQIGLTVLLATE